MDRKFKRLINNSFLFAIGNLGSKLITFIMLPLYTAHLSSEDFGISDLILTTVTLLLPIVTLSIYEAVLRFSMEKDSNRIKIFTNSLSITVLSSAILGILLLPFQFYINNYIIYVVLILIAQLFQTLFSQYAKSINQVKVFAFNGILLTLFTASLNIICLLVFNMGIKGYLYSILFANILSNLYLWITLKLYKDVSLQQIDYKFTMRMIRYSIPLIPNSIALWINNVANRYFILYYLTPAANGLFAVANKIPTLLGVLNSIFFQAWQMSAIEEFQSKDKDKFYSKSFYLYSQFMFVGSMFLLLILQPLVKFLVDNEFYISWKYIPLLIIGVLYSSFSSFFGQYYIAAKKTTGVFTTTILGAAINIIANFIFIPHLGLQGAGLSSAISFLSIWLIRVFDTQKLVKTTINWNNMILNNIFLMIQIYLVLNQDNIVYYYLVIGVSSVVSIIINRNLFMTILGSIRKSI